MKNILPILIMLIVGLSGTAFGQEKAAEDTETETAYAFPVLKPEISLAGGYRIVDLNGSSRAEEYEYLHNSATLAGAARIFSFPHRLSLDLDLKNSKDYFGDAGYAYEDLVVFRGINRTLFHNLDNITLIDLDPSTVIPNGPMASVRDAGQQYGVKDSISNLSLSLKAPDFPLHVYIDSTLTDKNGTQQQRFLGGAGGFATTGTSPNNVGLNKVSMQRDIDWTSRDITVGVNSHLGPVEADYSHGEKRFDAGGTPVLYENYLDVVSRGKIARAAGEYPHNQISDLKGSTDTLKVHTSYTGALVASATLSKTARENRDSGASSDYFIAEGEVTWTASPRLAVFVRYRHRDTDIDAPPSVTITDRSNPLNTYTYAVQPSISSKRDFASAIVRYRLMSGLTLKSEYSFEDIRRDVVATLNIPDDTKKNTLALSADMRLVRNMTVRAKYTHMEIDNPAYNTDPNRSDEGRLSLSWIPVPRISSVVSYSIAREKRNDIIIPDDPNAKNRDTSRDRLMGSVTVAVLDNLSCTGSYAYFHNRIRQDIAIGGIPIDFDVPYKNMAQSYSFDISYLPAENLSISGGISHTIGNGGFYPIDQALLQPVDISSYSRLKTRETVVSANSEYRFRAGFAAGVQYRYTDFRDALDNPYDDINSGRVHIVLLTLSKKW
ncbi:MAG: MtrB/PioB family outer membrane beta-barrel protein [Nitrospiraceae bacterium]|nr:MtrB/PioB family outer membrane beta-barrel protein [Nitrospiraceae bacterium]